MLSEAMPIMQIDVVLAFEMILEFALAILAEEICCWVWLVELEHRPIVEPDF